MLLAGTALAGTTTITVDAGKAGPRLNPRMYGIFLEEINFGVDGGLYAELIRNRGFEDAKPPEGFTLRDGRWAVLKSNQASDNNSLENPKKIVPVSSIMPVSGNSITHEFPAYSLSIMRLAAKGTAPIKSADSK